MTGIKVPEDIKRAILQFAFHDMSSAFYMNNWKDKIDDTKIQKDLSKWLAKEAQWLNLDGSESVDASIASDVRYIEISWNGFHNDGRYVTVNIMAELDPDEGESYDEFTSVFVAYEDGHTETL